MSNFKMMTRPKKPDHIQDLAHDLGDSIDLETLLKEVETFMATYPHLTHEDIFIECDWHYYNLYLSAENVTLAEFNKQMGEYKEQLKIYTKWKINNKDAIIKHKADEKAHIAKDKLEKSKSRLIKELAALEAKIQQSKQ